MGTRRVGQMVVSTAVGLLWACGWVHGQTAYPQPKLEAIFPPGGKIGTTVEVTLSGTDLDEAKALVFSHPGLKAELIPPPPPDPKKPAPPAPVKFRVAIASEVPPGLYEVSVVGRFGISNPRIFAVGELDEVVEQEPNNDVDQAQKVPVNVTVNGVINPNVDVDYFAVEGKKGQRLVVVCQAVSLDSRLDPQVQIFSAEGRQLAVNRRYRDREAVADAVLPADGLYYVRLVEFTHLTGGVEHFYRLHITTLPWIDAVFPPVVTLGKPATVTLYGRNLPGGQPENSPGTTGPQLEKLTVTVQPPTDPEAFQRNDFAGTVLASEAVLDGFTYRLKTPAGHSNPVFIALTDLPVVFEQEDNDQPLKARELSPPCELVGRIDRPGDRDWFTFTAKRGEVFWFEGFAERIGSPMDMFLEIYRLEKDQPQLVQEADDVDESLHRYRFLTRTSDPRLRFVVPQDGRYLVHVRSREADLFGGPRHIYRLRIDRERPDFRLFVLAADDVVQNTTKPGSLTLLRGGCRGVLVLCYRRDGFAGEVTLTAENLPPGVQCTPQILGPNQRFTSLVFQASPDAAIGEAAVRIRGSATMNGQTIVREARPAAVMFAVPAAASPYARLSRQFWLAVREKAPFTLQPSTLRLETPPGGEVVFKIKATPMQPDFKATVQLAPLAFLLLPNQQPNPQLQNVGTVNPNAEAEIKLQVPPQATPGTYNLVVRGTAQVSFTRDPKRAKPQNVLLAQEAPPIQVVVYTSVAELTAEPASLTAKPNEKLAVVVRLKRVHNYAGPFDVQLVLPPGVQGLASQPVQVPANANQTKLAIQVAGNLKPGMTIPAIIRATANLPNNVKLTHETKLEVKIAQ